MRSRKAIASYKGENKDNILNNERYFIRVRSDESVFPPRHFVFVYDGSTETEADNKCIGIYKYDEKEWSLDLPGFMIDNETEHCSMRTIHICPNCGCMQFSTTAAVSQDWIVNPCGEFIDELNSCSQVIHDPDNANIWTCIKCGEEAVTLEANDEEIYIPAEKEIIATTIKLTDVNVDGCGTDIETIVTATGPTITDEIKLGINETIKNRKNDLAGEWTTDDCIEAVDDYLKQHGYDVKYITPNIDIEINF